MVQIFAALALLSSHQVADPSTPGALFDQIKGFGYGVQVPPGGTSGWITAELGRDKVKVGFTVGINPQNKPTSLFLYNDYHFPHPVSLRAIQDWVARSDSRLTAQTYLNRVVSAMCRIDLGQTKDSGQLKGALTEDLFNYISFERWFCMPQGGTITETLDVPGDPSDFDEHKILDYADFTDLQLLIKHWGWKNTKPFGGALNSAIPSVAMIDGRQFKIVQSPKSVSGLIVSAALVPDAGRLTSYKVAHPDEEIAATSAMTTIVSMTIELRDGITIGKLRKEILDFAHRTEKLGPEAL